MHPKTAIYAELRRRIMAGRYEPGLQLKEELLAAEMGVSRTPIRTALQRLVGEHLLEARANRGVFVARWTDRDTEEVFDLRCILEPYAASLAARRATQEQVDELESLQATMSRSLTGDAETKIADLQQINNRFHQLILTASSSPRLIAIARNLIDWPAIVGTYYLFDEDEVWRSFHHHSDILSALKLKDDVLAARAMDVHLRRSFRAYMAHRAVASGQIDPDEKRPVAE